MTTTGHQGSIFGRRLRLAASTLAVALVSVGLVVPLTQAQTFTVLYTFSGRGGADPAGALLRDSAGNLYGTAEYGGSPPCGYALNCGTVFKLDTAGKFHVLHNFAGGDGAYPNAGLIHGSNGTFYSTTWQGGTQGSGTVYKLDATGNATVLYSFNDQDDGGFPYGGLVRDAAGNFYGTTSSGGNQGGTCHYGCGTVFKLDNSGNLTVLHSFTGRLDGKDSFSGLVRDAAGNLYGTTSEGGGSGCRGGNGCGTVYKVDAAGNYSVLYSFTGHQNGDGYYPLASLILDAAGNLYGTTYLGGTADLGTVFKLDAAGNETVLHTFTGKPNGSSPSAALVMDALGNLYGTTTYGGAHDRGSVFKLDPAGTWTVLHSFASGEGQNPGAALIMDPQGNLYGTTFSGGTHFDGTIFKVTP